MFGIGAQELLVILVVALLVFGPTKLPQLARSLGKALAEFRRASTDLRQSLQLDLNEGLRSSSQNAPKPPRLPDDASPAMAGADLPDEAAEESTSPSTAPAEASEHAQADAPAPDPEDDKARG